MVTSFVTYFESDKSLEGKLNSLVDIAVWNYYEEENKFTENGWYKVKIPNIIPTRFDKGLDENDLILKVDSFRNRIENIYNNKIGVIKDKISTEKNKKLILEKEKTINIMQKFVDNIDDEIKLIGPFGNGEFKAYNLITPPVETKLYSRYLSNDFITEIPFNYSFQIKQAMNFPLNIVEIENGIVSLTQERMPFEIIKNIPVHIIDFETTEYEKLSIMKKLVDKSEDELQELFKQYVKVYNFHLKHNNFEYMTKKDFLRGIDKVLDSKRNERFTAGVFSSIDKINNGKGLFNLINTLDSGLNKISVDDPKFNNISREFDIEKVQNQEEIIDNYNKSLINVLLLGGVYHIFFDYNAVDRLVGNQQFGMEGKTAKHKGQIIDYRKTKMIPGRLNIDISAYAQKIMKLYNNKMDTVCREVSGIKTKKTLNHQELEISSQKALKGDKEEAKKLLYYTAQDGLKPWYSVSDLFSEHIHLSRIFNNLFYRIDATGIDSLTEEYWFAHYFKNKKSYPFYGVKNLTSEFQGKEKKYDEIKIQELLHSELGNEITTRPGLYNGFYVSIFPLAKTFEKFLSRDPNVKKFYEFIRNTDDVKTKERSLTWLEQIAKYPYLFMTKYPDEKMFNAHFSVKSSEQGFHEISERFEKNINSLSEFYSDHPPINYNGCTFILPADEDFLARKYILPKFGVVRGKGLFLSGIRGSYAGNIDGQLIMHGIADYNSKKGERNIFETNIFDKFFTKVLFENDYMGFLNYLHEKIEMFHNGETSEIEMRYERTVKRDHTAYAASAKQKFIRFIREKQSLREDKISYEYPYEELITKFFGFEETQPKRQYSFVFDNEPRDVYEKWIDDKIKYYKFAPLSSGTIGKITRWLFAPEKNSVEETLLAKMFLGEISDRDYERLAFKFEKKIKENLNLYA